MAQTNQPKKSRSSLNGVWVSDVLNVCRALSHCESTILPPHCDTPAPEPFFTEPKIRYRHPPPPPVSWSLGPRWGKMQPKRGPLMNRGESSTQDQLAKWLVCMCVADDDDDDFGSRAGAHPRHSVLHHPAPPDRDPGVCPPQHVYLEWLPSELWKIQLLPVQAAAIKHIR